MSTISLQELQRDPESLIDRVQAGESLVVSRDGRPIAQIRPIAQPLAGGRPFGLCAGEFSVPADFDEPLPDEILDGFEGR